MSESIALHQFLMLNHKSLYSTELLFIIDILEQKFNQVDSKY